MKNKRFFIALISAALALIMAFPAFADVVVSPIEEIVEGTFSGIGAIIIGVLVAALVIAAAVIAIIIFVVRNDRKNAANRTAVKKDDDGSGENKA